MQKSIFEKDGFMVNDDIQMDIKVTHAGSEQFLVVSGFLKGQGRNITQNNKY